MFTTHPTVDDLAERWTAMWNGDLDAAEIVAPDAVVALGRIPRGERATTLTGPAETQEVVDGIRASAPGIRYGHDIAAIPAAGAAERGVFTLIWHVEAPGLPLRTGLDVLAYEGDRIRRVWSVTGDLPLPGDLPADS